MIPREDPAWPEDAVEVGRVLDAWGVKGWIKVHPHAAQPQALFGSRRWFLKPDEPAPARPAERSRTPPLPPVLHITQVRSHGDLVVASAHDVPDRAAAEALKGARIFVSRASFPTPDADEYYWVDLIGLSVVNREGQVLGTVIDLLDTGPHCVLRLDTGVAGHPERLIPFVAAYVDDVSLARRCIQVDWQPDYD